VRCRFFDPQPYPSISIIEYVYLFVPFYKRCSDVTAKMGSINSGFKFRVVRGAAVDDESLIVLRLLTDERYTAHETARFLCNFGKPELCLFHCNVGNSE
jgi:hypothetical protein